jgi:putative MFS transporter
VWGRLADRIGRRAVFMATVLNFSIATGVLAMTPDHGWIFLTITLCHTAANSAA